jgi:hypothetical protein
MKSMLEKRQFYEDTTSIPVGPKNAERIYQQVQDYCDNRCQDPANLNPMTTCLPTVCILAKLKKEALSYTTKSSQK